MRAVQSVPGHDEPQVVEVDDLSPGPGQVLIQVAAAPVHPFDVFVATEAGRGAVAAGRGFGLGWDVSGVVLEVGPGVTGFAIGDLVAGARRRHGRRAPAQADLVVLDAEAVAVVPEGLDLVDAASIPLNAITAHQALACSASTPDARCSSPARPVPWAGTPMALAEAAGWDVTGLGRPGRRGVRAVDRRGVHRARRPGVVRRRARRRGAAGRRRRPGARTAARSSACSRASRRSPSVGSR